MSNGESQDDRLTGSETSTTSTLSEPQRHQLIPSAGEVEDRSSSAQALSSLSPVRLQDSSETVGPSQLSAETNSDVVSMETDSIVTEKESSQVEQSAIASGVEDVESAARLADHESTTTSGVIELQAVVAVSSEETVRTNSGASSAEPSVSQSADVLSSEGSCKDDRPASTPDEIASLLPSTDGCAVATESADSAPTERDVTAQDDQMEMETAPHYNYTLGQELKLLCGSWSEFDRSNYLRGCKWSPDGTCLLTCSDDNKLRLYNLPTELYTGVVDELPEMSPVLTVPQGDLVYDFTWYPNMSSWNPETCCFVTSCKDLPVHLWDAFYLHKRASYLSYNHVDELVAPHSLTFSLDGERLYCGFHKCVKVFSVSRPGRECRTRTTYEKKQGGQPGIISSIVMHPAHHDTFALGSYSCSVGLYSERTRGATMVLDGVGSGVTHMLFSPDGNYLFIGLRKNDLIKCWDLRNTTKILYSLRRQVTTNQRIYFDLSHCKRYLFSGSTSGYIYGWDITSEKDQQDCLQPLLKFPGCSDAVNGCSAHPTLPLLATSSGQRKFSLPTDGSSSSETEEEEEDRTPVHVDNSVRLWSLLGRASGSYEEIVGSCEDPSGVT